jgi:hypothetical protein
MVKLYRDAIAPKLSQAVLIKSMQEVVNEYCPDRHIFELMFNPSKVIECEKLARKDIGINNPEIYSYYHLNISTPFRQMIVEDWKELEKAQAKTAPLSDGLFKPLSQHKPVIFNQIYYIK